MPASPRLLCFRALTEWEKGSTFSDEILQTLLARHPLPPGERAFLRELFFGTLRHLSALDFLIGRLRPTGEVDAPTRALLRLGLYQLFYLRTPAHAAVHETVSLAKQTRGLVNAVLRRATREGRELEAALAQAPREVHTSHPEFLLRRWEAQFGPEATQLLVAWNNQPAEVFVRANGLRTSAAALAGEGSGAEPVPFHPGALRVKTLPPRWLEEGLCYVQDPSTLAACDLLAPRPGETVLDACAAPGGKTSYLAELMGNSGRLVAADLYTSRLERLRSNLQRLGVTNTEIVREDALTGGEALQPGRFDRVLLDVPCTNTGVLRRRVDVRWRLTEEDFLRLPVQQAAMLHRAAEWLKPGGTLVYSTCSLEQEENEAVVEQVQARTPSLRFLESRRVLPFVDGVDGAYAARFTKE